MSVLFIEEKPGSGGRAGEGLDSTAALLLRDGKPRGGLTALRCASQQVIGRDWQRGFHPWCCAFLCVLGANIPGEASGDAQEGAEASVARGPGGLPEVVAGGCCWRLVV